MTTFTDLRNFGNKLVEKANEWHIPFQLWFYSAKIGRYVKVHEIHRMSMQTKYVMLFKGKYFDDMQVVINTFSPLGKYSLLKNQDSRQKNRYGRDIYQNVKEFTLYQEQASSPTSYDAVKLKEDKDRLLKAQRKAFLDQDDFNESELEEKIEIIKGHLESVYSYLIDPQNAGRCVSLKRSSGVAHKLKVKPNTGSKKITFGSLLILFGEGDQFPKQTEPQKSKGGGNPSITAQYNANPSSFKYYDRFGIFEVYDNKP